MPTWDKHAGVRCHGVELFVTDAARFQPFRTGLACVLHARPAGPRALRLADRAVRVRDRRAAFDLLCGSDRERRAIEAGATLSELVRPFPAEERAFERRRRPFLLYPP